MRIVFSATIVHSHGADKCKISFQSAGVNSVPIHVTEGFKMATLRETILKAQHAYQRFPLTFKLAGPAANLGVRHGSVVVGAHWRHSNTIQAAAWLVKLR